MKYVNLAAVYLIWGSTYFAVKVVVSDGSPTPLQLQFVRAGCAAILLSGVAVVMFVRQRQHGEHSAPDSSGELTERDARTRRRALWKRVAAAAASGILMWAAGNGFATYSAPNASSSFIVMAMGTIPLWTVVVEAATTRRLPSRRVVIVLGVGLIGLILIVGPGALSSEIVAPEFALPITLMLAGAGLTWAMGTAVQKRIARHFSIPGLAAIQFAGAALVLAVPVAAERAAIPASISTEQCLAFGYLVVFGSVVSLSSYAVVVRKFSAAVASTFAYINPVVGIILGIAVLQEEIQPLSVVGLLVVLVAVFSVLHGSAGSGSSSDLRSQVSSTDRR